MTPSISLKGALPIVPEVGQPWKIKSSRPSSMTEEEKLLLFQEQEATGNHWTQLIRLFPSRTDDDLKTQFYILVRKGVRKAKRMVSRKSATPFVNSIKSTALLEFLEEWIELKKPMMSGNAPMSWMKPRFQGREFVKFFAFTYFDSTMPNLSDIESEAITIVLDILEKINIKYCQKRQGISVEDSSGSLISFETKCSESNPMFKCKLAQKPIESLDKALFEPIRSSEVLPSDEKNVDCVIHFPIRLFMGLCDEVDIGSGPTDFKEEQLALKAYVKRISTIHNL